MPKPECPLCDIKNCLHDPRSHLNKNFTDIYFNYTTSKKTYRYILQIDESKIDLLVENEDKVKHLTSFENILTENKSNNIKIINKVIENLLFI